MSARAPAINRAGHLVRKGTGGRSSMSGRDMDAALWRDKPTGFDAEGLYKTGQSEVLVILVSTLMKFYRGRGTVSYDEAGKFYVNPDILKLPTVRWITAEDDYCQVAFKQSEREAVEIAVHRSKLISLSQYALYYCNHENAIDFRVVSSLLKVPKNRIPSRQ